MELRNYQIQSVESLSKGFAQNLRQVLCLPTGAGKTVVFSDIVCKAAKRGTVTLVLTDRTELFKQTVKALGRFDVAVEEIKPNKKNTYKGATIYVAMVETLKRRKELLDKLPINLIIADEAHKQNFNKIFDAFPEAFVIGATATPVGKHFYKYYQSIVQTIDVPDLVDQGFLVPCRAFQMVDDFSDLEKSRMGDFTSESLNNHFKDKTLYDGVINWWKKKAIGKKTIVFNCSIEHCAEVTQQFLDAGISSESITSKTPKDERDRILEAFKNGHFSVLNNCGILTTGYDEPTIECVILNRATESLPLYLQMIGRGSRLIDSRIGGLETSEDRKQAIAQSSKPFFTVLDFGGNHDRHGLWNEGRSWTIEPPKRKRKGLQVAPVKTCPDCEAMVGVREVLCPYCGYEWQASDRELKKGGKLVEITVKDFEGLKVSDCSIDDLINLQRLKKYKATYIWRVVRSRGVDALLEYAEKMEYSKGWIYKQKEKLSDSSFTNYSIKE